jgi:hypothetical protein
MVIARVGHVTCASFLFILFVSPGIKAHHGRDFLLTQTAHLPAKGEIYAIARQDFVDEGEEKEWEFEPAAIAAVADWLTLEVHSHIEKVKGESTEYESTAAAGYFRFNPRESALAVGGAVEYEVARHSDDEDLWEFAGLASYEAGDWMFGLNLLAEREAGGGAEMEWGYAAGVRRTLSDKVAAGLEVAGTLQDGEEGEILMAFLVDPLPWLTINVGLGTGFNGGTDLSLRSAFVFRLR